MIAKEVIVVAVLVGFYLHLTWQKESYILIVPWIRLFMVTGQEI